VTHLYRYSLWRIPTKCIGLFSWYGTVRGGNFFFLGWRSQTTQLKKKENVCHSITDPNWWLGFPHRRCGWGRYVEVIQHTWGYDRYISWTTKETLRIVSSHDTDPQRSWYNSNKPGRESPSRLLGIKWRTRLYFCLVPWIYSSYDVYRPDNIDNVFYAVKKTRVPDETGYTQGQYVPSTVRVTKPSALLGKFVMPMISAHEREIRSYRNVCHPSFFQPENTGQVWHTLCELWKISYVTDCVNIVKRTRRMKSEGYNIRAEEEVMAGYSSSYHYFVNRTKWTTTPFRNRAVELSFNDSSASNIPEIRQSSIYISW